MPRAFSLREIARATKIPLRTLRFWIEKKVLPRPAFRGGATRYDEAFVLRARAAEALRRERRGLAAIRLRLGKASPEEVARLAASVPADLPAGPVAPRPEALPAPYGVPPDVASSERWERIVLVPGIELFVRDLPGLRKLARQIVADYRPSGG